MSEKFIDRREFLKLGAALPIVGLAATLPGCASGEESGGGPVEIIFSAGPEDTGILQRQIDRFNDANEGEIRVSWREMPADVQQYLDQLRTQFQAGKNDIDVISGDVIWPAELASNGWLADLSERFSEDERSRFVPSTIEANTFDGGVYGVPWFTDAGILYYRRDLLEDSGYENPPQTWEELREMARRVQSDSGIANGFVFQGQNSEAGLVCGLEFIWNAGGDVLAPDDPSRVVLESEQTVEGLADEREMIESGVSPRGVVNYAATESYIPFLAGDALFLRSTPFIYGLIGDPEQSSIETSQVGVAQLPTSRPNLQSRSALGGFNLFINATSEKQDAAWEFARFMTTEDQQRERASEAAYFPTLSNLYTDEDLTDEVPVIGLGREAVENTKPRPISPFYGDFSLALAEGLNDSLSGESSPEDAARKMQSDLEEIVASAN